MGCPGGLGHMQRPLPSQPVQMHEPYRGWLSVTYGAKISDPAAWPGREALML